MQKLENLLYDDELSEFDLSQTAPCDDRLMTKLTLDDYDWMYYTLETYLPTRKQGFLYVKVEYSGFVSSEMFVKQKLEDGVIVVHKIGFDSKIFSDFLVRYMNQHIAQWNETYAFSGGKLMIELFNEILNNAKSYELSEGEKA